MNTWRRDPGQQKHDPNDAITWISPDGKTMRQVDYILINHRHRNFVRKAHTIHEWRGNAEQNRQHSAIIMKIQLRYKHQSLAKPPPETGAEIKYNIRQARKQPELLERHFPNKQIHIQYQQNKTATENWNDAKQIIHEALKHVYLAAKVNSRNTNMERK